MAHEKVLKEATKFLIKEGKMPSDPRSVSIVTAMLAKMAVSPEEY